MSRMIVNQNWETADAPYTLVGAGIARTTTDAINTTSLRCAGGLGGGLAQYDVPVVDEAKRGSARSRKARMTMNFKLHTACSGGYQLIVVEGITGYGFYINSGSNAIQFYNGSTYTAGSALTVGQVYSVDIEWREERDTQIWVRLWLDGVLDINYRTAVSSSNNWGQLIVHGGVGGGKLFGVGVWDDIKFSLEDDPQ